jgi:hypothetical protein
MKKIIFILLGLMIMTGASAAEDEYVPLVQQGRKWIFMRYEHTTNHQINPLYFYSLEIKDLATVFYTRLDDNLQPEGESSAVAFLMQRGPERRVERMPIPEGWPYQPLDIEEIRTYIKIVPFWYSIDDQFYEIYNFSNDDYLPLPYGLSPSELDIYRQSSEITTVTVGNESRNARVLNKGNFFLEAKVIQGVGIDSRSGDLLTPQQYYAEPTSKGAFDWTYLTGLVAVYDGNELVYQGCLYDNAMEFASIKTVAGDRQAQSVRYYNLAGVESAEPQPGISIKVTTWSDGSRTSEKVVR